jgi:hypothetical protein
MELVGKSIEAQQERAAHDAAVARVMAILAERKIELAAFFALPISPSDLEIVRARNATHPGILGTLWAEFIELPLAEKISALSEPNFKGMSWQSLMQSNPYRMVM